MGSTEQAEKIEALAALILKETREHMTACYSAERASWYDVQIVPGKAYTKIDRGTHPGQGFLMIELATGCIFGIKGYGKVNKGHFYGTLDTTGDWSWGDTIHDPQER